MAYTFMIVLLSKLLEFRVCVLFSV